MIVNPHSLTTLQIEWRGVVRMRERVRHLAISTFTADPARSPAFGDVFYNLPLVLAYDVLKQVLLHAKEEGRFKSSRNQLADLLESAKKSIPWLDWEGLSASVQARNEVAHRGKLFGDVKCLQDIARIEAQLMAWGIIDAV
jgi:hypothetical protein